MAVLKCKMCGGDLKFEEGVTVVDCEYCGTKQTVPTIDDEKKITLFSRANRLRYACEFDKASGVYESIVADFPEEAEAYWGLVLCKYGIEYVDDPATGKKIPTCHRSSFESVMEDENFEQALENADPIARSIYREEAKQIEELRRGIIEVSSKEEPYDIFICYKETAENGERTIDSVIAQDVYHELTEKGYRVFFSRITLEDKLGQEYEPYIFAALNSARIMLAFGTDYEYYNAVWVKNEWSRFLQLIAKGEKKTLIPCYKGIDAYDMPKEFARLQAQDMGKVGAVQDLLRGIEKLLPKKENEQAAQAQSGKENVIVRQSAQSATVDSLLKRAFMYLEDSDWSNATEYCNRVLDINPENAEAYVGLLMAELRVSKEEELAHQNASFIRNKYFMKAVNFSTEERRKILEGYRETIDEKKKQMAKKRQEAGTRSVSIFQYDIGKYKDGACFIFALVRGADTKAVVTYSRGAYPWKGMDVVSVAQGMGHTVGLKSDGSVVATGLNDSGECRVSSMKGIQAIAAGNGITVGIKPDGTIEAVGDGYSRAVIAGWKDIVAIEEGWSWTAGLRSDGTVVSTGHAVSHWKNIIAIAGDIFLLVGLKSDGTVITASDRKYENEWEPDISGWKEIVEIKMKGYLLAGLRSDGTVVATTADAQIYEGIAGKVADWRDIVSIAVDDAVILGLKSDGTVVVAVNENNRKTMGEVSDWKDITAIAAHSCGAVGLKSDGTIVVTTGRLRQWIKEGEHRLERQEVELHKQKEEEKEEKRRQEQQKFRSLTLCQHCGGEFKGLLSKKCSVCGRPKDY